MNQSKYACEGHNAWIIARQRAMRWLASSYATAHLIQRIDGRVYPQIANFTSLSGILAEAYVMSPACGRM